MSGPLASSACALNKEPNIDLPATSAEEAFKNARRDMVGGIIMGGCCLIQGL
jgi:hypothetical protein